MLDRLLVLTVHIDVETLMFVLQKYPYLDDDQNALINLALLTGKCA